MDNLIARQKLHATVFSQCFSTCGKYLATGDNYGHISVFSLLAALSQGAPASTLKPVFRFKAHDGPIYSLVTTERQLISAGTGDIQGWNWADITAKTPRAVWSLPVKSLSQFDTPEVNSMIISKQAGTVHLVAGCGNNNVHMWDLDSGRAVTTFEGHTDYVHQVSVRSNGSELLSASEDGTVRLWDIRTGTEVQRIEPHLNEMAVRPELGKWLGCVAVDSMDDWLVCGGGPHLSLWHFRSLSCTAIFDAPKVVHQQVMFHDDSVISAGGSASVYHWGMNGDQKARVPCTPSSVYSVAINTSSHSSKVLSVAGNSPLVDIYTNFGYKTFSFSIF